MKKQIITLISMIFVTILMTGCIAENQEPKSTSGVTKAQAKVTVGSDGLTEEQRNIKSRTELENTPGSIKHLYVISPYSGQVIIYSTVKGKVTSSGKRLTPDTSVNSVGDFSIPGIVDRRGNIVTTNEIIQDDGTYGSSNPYIYWFDSQSRYHQHFFTGGQIIHISDQPMPVKDIVINMELTNSK